MPGSLLDQVIEEQEDIGPVTEFVETREMVGVKLVVAVEVGDKLAAGRPQRGVPGSSDTPIGGVAEDPDAGVGSGYRFETGGGIIG
jgi:hypothetical protein